MSEARLPSSLADLAPAFEAVKAKGKISRVDIMRQEGKWINNNAIGIGKADMMYTHQMLDTSLQHVPDLVDSER